MTTHPLRVLLADDDDDDCLFFKEALAEQSASAALTVVNDGEQLMDWLRQPENPLPNVLFLDLNMPRLSGYDCLGEIKRDQRLTHLPVVILSTFIAPELQEKLYALGAMHCLQKPTDYKRLKVLIEQAIDKLATAAEATAGEKETSTTGPAGDSR